MLWDLADFDEHENVHFVHDRESGLRAIIAVHSTALGPSAGGARFWHYPNSQDALVDALRLSRGMSYKNAMADLPLGGGKAVILAPMDRCKTSGMLAAFGRFVEAVGGQYVTAEDVGMTSDDMKEIGKETRYVSGLPVGESGQAGGDPGPFTAQGVYLGVKAAAQFALGRSHMNEVSVAIQGVGSVGGGLARRLAQDGAKITIADIDEEKARILAREIGADIVGLDQIMEIEADIFSPNALGAVLNVRSIPKLKAKIVAGGANNQFASTADATLLHERSILYAPDYVINSGGIINVGIEYLGNGDFAEVDRRVRQIPERLTAIWEQSERDGISSAYVADTMAREYIGRA